MRLAVMCGAGVLLKPSPSGEARSLQALLRLHDGVKVLSGQEISGHQCTTRE